MIAWVMRNPFWSGLLLGLILAIYPVTRSLLQSRILQHQVTKTREKIETLNKQIGSIQQQSTDLSKAYGTCLAALRLAEDRQRIFEKKMKDLKVNANALRVRINRLKYETTEITTPTSCTAATDMAIDAAKTIKSFWEGP